MIKDKNLFAFLKSRAIFTKGGAKDYHEAISHLENKLDNQYRARHPRKKATKRR